MSSPLPIGTLCRGEDCIGKFFIRRNSANYGCPGCTNIPQVIVHYRGPKKLSDYVMNAPSFIMRSRNPRYKMVNIVGIDCGCYAKVQRQVVHIEKSRS